MHFIPLGSDPVLYNVHTQYTDPQEFITSQLERFEIDSVTVILAWPQGNPLHSYQVIVLPHVEVTFLGKVRAQLKVAYDIQYNVSVVATSPCGQNAAMAFTVLQYGESTA